MAVVSVLLLTIIGCGDESPTQLTYSGELLIYNWEDYFAPDTLKNFEEEFGVAVQLTTFDSEDTMLAALQSDPSMYDLVIASGATIETLRSLRLLAPISTKSKRPGTSLSWALLRPGRPVLGAVFVGYHRPPY